MLGAILTSQFNNYQAIVVSDVLRTYVVFSYKCGEIEWSAIGANRAAVVGFNAAGKYFSNHRLSEYEAIGNTVSCVFDLGKRRKRQNPGNNMGMQIPAGVEKLEQIEKCINAFNSDEQLLFLIPLDNLANMLDPCPTTTGKLYQDRGKFRRQVDITQSLCYTANPVRFTLLFSGEEITLTQQCCYDRGYVCNSIDTIIINILSLLLSSYFLLLSQ